MPFITAIKSHITSWKSNSHFRWLFAGFVALSYIWITSLLEFLVLSLTRHGIFIGSESRSAGFISLFYGTKCRYCCQFHQIEMENWNWQKFLYAFYRSNYCLNRGQFHSQISHCLGMIMIIFKIARKQNFSILYMILTNVSNFDSSSSRIQYTNRYTFL